MSNSGLATSHSLNHVSSVPSLQSSKASLSGRGRSAGNDGMTIALGLDEEVEESALAEAHGSAGAGAGSGFAAGRERKLARIRRPRTRDKEGELPGTPVNQEGWAAFSTGHKGTITPAEEVAGFALDTNFDHIDDFVDVSVRQRNPNADGLIVPLSDGTSDTSPPPTSPRVDTDGTPGSSAHHRSTSFVLQPVPPHSRQSSSQRIAASSQGFGPSASAGQLSSRRPKSAGTEAPVAEEVIDLQSKPNLKKMTKSQYSAMIRNQIAAADWSGGAKRLPGLKTPDLAMLGQGGGGSGDDGGMASRKASVASGRSDQSGVSPKSSFANLAAAAAQQQGHGKDDNSGTWQIGDDAQFRFPPSKTRSSISSSGGALGLDRAPRKSSAGLSTASEQARKLNSAWLAPDSWAVQPESRAFSMEEEHDSDDSGEAAAAAIETRVRRTSSQGTGTGSGGAADSLQGRPWTSEEAGSSGRDNSRAGTAEGRRATAGSVASTGTLDLTGQARGLQGSQGSLPSAGRASEIEIVDNAWGSSAHLGPSAASTAASTPAADGPNAGAPHVSHRGMAGRGGGGALAAASGAAAAAAGKLGLRGHSSRAQKQHQQHTRPSTGGSLAGPRPTGGSLGGGGSADEEQANSSLMFKDPHRAIRRAGTAPGAGSGAVSVTKPVSLTLLPGCSATLPDLRYVPQHLIRIWRKDGSFVTLSCALLSTTVDIRTLLSRKNVSLDDAACRLFIRDKGNGESLLDIRSLSNAHIMLHFQSVRWDLRRSRR